MRQGLVGLLVLAWTCTPARAPAYRPFDSTDAAVAAKGDLELELGPVGFLRDGRGQLVVLPAMIFNLGIARGWEVVLRATQLVLADPSGGARWRLVDTALSVKGILRAGSLQSGRGPSVATELGVLLPSPNDEPGPGLIGRLIVSQRWAPMTMHANGGVAYTRAGDLGLVGGIILEGPRRWAIRPVAELLGEWERNGPWLASGLVGAIWQATAALSLDVGLRAGRASAANVLEVRAGLTYAIALWRDL
jgi:hypothetical protein